MPVLLRYERLLITMKSSNATNVVSVALVVTEYVSTVEHYNPGVVGVDLKSRGGPIAQGIPKRNILPHNRTQFIVQNASIQQGFKIKAKIQRNGAFDLDHKDKISDYDQHSDNVLGSRVLIRLPCLTTFFKGFAPMR